MCFVFMGLVVWADFYCGSICKYTLPVQVFVLCSRSYVFIAVNYCAVLMLFDAVYGVVVNW